VPINKITMVGVTFNKDALANDPLIYINGISVNVTETSTPTGTAFANDAAETLTIGNTSSQTETFDGFIDDASVYGSILTSVQMLIIAKAPQSYIDNFRTDEIPSITSFNFDVLL